MIPYRPHRRLRVKLFIDATGEEERVFTSDDDDRPPRGGDGKAQDGSAAAAVAESEMTVDQVLQDAANEMADVELFDEVCPRERRERCFQTNAPGGLTASIWLAVNGE